jgi:hypothetical protein
MEDALVAIVVSMECGTNPEDPDVQEALEDYERLVVHSSRRVYKLEESGYPDVSPSKTTARLFWNI